MHNQGQTIADSSDKFEIIYLADLKYASNPSWISQIKTWGATGINLRVYRNNLEDSEHKFYLKEWNNISNSLKLLSDSALDIYIRINMFGVPFEKRNNYTEDDYQQTKDMVMYSTYLKDDVPTLNLTSPNAFKDRIRFFKQMTDSLTKLSYHVMQRIKLIVPTISQDDETELTYTRKYPPEGNGIWGWLSGYSESEQNAFIRYLLNKYSTVADLNTVWDTNFTAINRENIRIKDYNWENLRDKYILPNGRKDFINFLTGQLKNFIDTCADIVHSSNNELKIGVQFGSVYDSGIEFKAFYDVTSLLENVDMVICDDIIEYHPNFNFAANYLRSICDYWNWKRANNKSSLSPLTFATETNWPGYGHILPDTLVKYWQIQLQSYYERGASAIFISHWGTADVNVTWLPVTPPVQADPYLHLYIGDLIINDELTNDGPYIQSSAYLNWKNTLNYYKTLSVTFPSTSNFAVHLIPSKALYNRGNDDTNSIHSNNNQFHNVQDSVFYFPTWDGKNSGYRNVWEFPLDKFVKSRLANSDRFNYNKNYDIVTDDILENSPEFILEKYTAIY